MKKSRFDYAAGYTIGIYVLFLAGFLALVMFGAGAYRQAAESRDRNNDQRALRSYVSVLARNNDRTGAVSLREGPEGDMLVLADGKASEKREFRLYLSGGELVQEYARAEDPPGGGEIQSIGACKKFAVTRCGLWSLRVTMDDTDVLLHFRSEVTGAL